MRDLAQALTLHSAPKAKLELANWGGWWRNRYRENPAQARRVLAELASMIRERRIHKNTGAAGKDLWTRFA
jgi:hypothetical protein